MISELDTVDILATRPDRSEVILVIVDHLDWADVGDHLEHLQDKLAAYLRFIHSGQLAEERPEAATARVVIEVVELHEPPPAALRFYDAVRPFLARHDVDLRRKLHLPC